MKEDSKSNVNEYKHISDIKKNYQRMEEEFVTQLNYEINNHYVIAGGNREEIWKLFFERIIPKKFNIARSVFIIDSKGKVSKEIDIAIYDEQYTPYIFNYGLIKFIPVEAVSAVVQCKSYNFKEKELKEWADSINDLDTSGESIVRIATGIHIGPNNTLTQTATKPIKIICYLNKNKRSSITRNNGKNGFDIVIEAHQKSFKDEDKNKIIEKKFNIKFNDKNLFDVLKKYNMADKCDGILEMEEDKNKKFKESFDKLKDKKITNYEIKDSKKEKYSLLSFIFQFNQMLMMINNPMFFPHIAYVNMFNSHKEKGE